MYLLDTNVLSELRKRSSGRINPQVERWATEVDPSSLHVSVITVMELDSVSLNLSAAIPDKPPLCGSGCIIASCQPSPDASCRSTPPSRCAHLHVPDPKSERDAWIAATGLAHDLTIVTRNSADFAATGATLLNPWREGSPL